VTAFLEPHSIININEAARNFTSISLKPRAAEYSGAGLDKMSSPKRRIETDVSVPEFRSLTDSWKKDMADTVLDA
jgi:hypothetical protein